MREQWNGRGVLLTLTTLAVIALTVEALLSTTLGHHTGVLLLATTLTIATVTVAATGGHIR